MNERLRIATSRFGIECLKSACEILFILSGVWNSATCTRNKLFPRGALKNRWSENFSKLQIDTRSSHPEVFCKKIFLKILQISQRHVFAGVAFLILLHAGNLKMSEAATGNVLLKKVFLKGRAGVSEPAVRTSSTQNRC